MKSTNIIASDFKHGSDFSIQNFCIIEEGCVVGNNVKIGNYVYLKKGTIIGDDVFIDSYVKSSGQNRIGSRVTIRFNATIAREVIVEDDVFIGGGTLVPPNKTLESGYLYVGNPAKQIRPLKESELSFLKQSALNYIELKNEYLE